MNKFENFVGDNVINMGYENNITTKIFYTWKAINIYLLFSGGGLFLSIFLVQTLQLPHSIGWTAFLVFFVGPIISAPFWKKLFTREVIVGFCDEYFSIRIISNKSVSLNSLCIYKLADLRFFKTIESARANTSVLKLYFRNGKKVNYTFLEQTDKPETNIVANIHRLIRTHNLKQIENNKITFAPNVYATKKGTYYILCLTILLGIALTLQIFYYPKSIPISLLPAIFIYLMIIAQRKKDKESFEKWKNNM